MKNYIYALVDPRNSQIRYIGKCVNLRKRYSSTFTFELNTDKDTHKTLWIKSLFKETGQYPILEIIRVVDSQYIVETEIFCINEYRRLGCDLTNTAKGGIGGNTGNYQKPNIETLRKLKQNKRKTNLKGTKQTSEHIAKRMANMNFEEIHKKVQAKQVRRRFYEKLFNAEKRTAWNKGLTVSEEVKKKVSEGMKRYVESLSPEEYKAYKAKATEKGLAKIHEEVKAGLREHPAKGNIPWNKGIEVPKEIHQKAWETRRKNTIYQRDYLKIIAEHSGESISKVERALKGQSDKVSAESCKKIWDSYYALGDQVSGLKVKLLS